MGAADRRSASEKAGYPTMRLASALAFAVAVGGSVAVSGAAYACPNYQAQPAFGQIDLNEGFTPDPYYRNIRAGGGYSLRNCGFENDGWVAVAPDFDLYYNTNGTSPLIIAVESNVDTIILVNDPDGQWWYDDDNGLGEGAKITIARPKSGLYDIWIGTYNRASGIPGRLVITELD